MIADAVPICTRPPLQTLTHAFTLLIYVFMSKCCYTMLQPRVDTTVHGCLALLNIYDYTVLCLFQQRLRFRVLCRGMARISLCAVSCSEIELCAEDAPTTLSLCFILPDQACFIIRLETWLSTLEIVYLCVFRRRH